VADLRLGLIGCGLLAERGYRPAFARARGVCLAAVADPVRERCERVAPGVPAFAGAADVVAAGAVDALVLATPAKAHLEDARIAAAAGIPSLVEKPPATTAAAAAELAGLEPMPFVGFNRRFEPKLRELRAAALAAPSVELELVLERRPGSWQAYENADPVALDLGPHLVDLAFWLSGAATAHASGEAREDRLSLELELAERGTARIECALGPRYRELVRVSGIGSYRRGGLRSAFRTSPLVPSLARQLEAFARRGAELATAADGLRVMRALECVTS
jgi:myo-inositol 2-dehydrogenase / D-chiro-inositol 1-dehydrogenase